MTGDSIKPMASPINVMAMNIIHTLCALNSSSQAMANGMFTTIMAHFRPSESKRIDDWNFSFVKINIKFYIGSAVVQPVINADKRLPNGSQTYTRLPNVSVCV